MTISELDLLIESRIPVQGERRRERAARPASFRISVFENSARGELQRVTHSLASLLAGGIPLLRALEIASSSARHPNFKKALQEIIEAVRQGKTFSEAVSRYPVFFPEFYRQMLCAGELSGTLEEIFRMLGAHLRRQSETRRKTMEAVTYPAFVLLMGIVTTGVLLKFVVPKIAAVYSGFGAGLPASMSLMIGLGNLFLPAVLIFTAAAAIALRAARRGREYWGSALLQMPGAGRFLRHVIQERFFGLMALLVRSGVPILEALSCASNAVPFISVRGEIAGAAEKIKQGAGFAQAVGNLSWMTPDAFALAEAGEESGRLEECFLRIAEDSRSELEIQAQILMKLLEPMMILAVGAVVAWIVISTVLPLVDMNGLMK